MNINYPPKYRYALFESWDKKAFDLISKLAKSKHYPEIIGNKKDKNDFLISLIRTQKSLHGWRNFLIDTLDQVKKTNKINTRNLNIKYPPGSISKEIPSWVTYKEDKIVSDFIDRLSTKKMDLIGTDREISEFVLRFILGQLAHDWEQTIMMIWEMLGKKNKLNIKTLNRELKNFDYLKLFEF